MTYNITFLPAKYGDAIWVEYGHPEDLKRILIDGGTGGTKEYIKKEIAALPPSKRTLELLVVTHIDRDHIEGILSLLQEEKSPVVIEEIWFNGWPHLPGNTRLEFFGAIQGEKLTAAILKHGIPWNTSFKNGPVVIPGEQLPVIQLEGGMEITLLSPYPSQLETLKKVWAEELMKANLEPGAALALPQESSIESFGVSIPDIEALSKEPFHEDSAPGNGSSIAFIASFAGKSVLFAGDAFPNVVLQSLNRLSPTPVTLDLVKLSHHASSHNTSPALIGKFEAHKFAISTNGSIYKHPSQVTIARLIKQQDKGIELIFNYSSSLNTIWNNTSLQKKYSFTTCYPTSEGITVNLL